MFPHMCITAKDGGFALVSAHERRFRSVKNTIRNCVRRSRFASQFSCTISKCQKPPAPGLTEDMTTMAMMKNGATMTDAEDNRLSARDFAELGGRKLVYIRTVAARDVIEDLIDDEGELTIEIEDGDILYSVHSSSGERLALVGNRELAFAAARQYEMNPVSVH